VQHRSGRARYLRVLLLVDAQEKLGQAGCRLGLHAGQERAQLLVMSHDGGELELGGPQPVRGTAERLDRPVPDRLEPPGRIAGRCPVLGQGALKLLAPLPDQLVELGPVLVPEFRAPQAGRFDLTGSLLSLAAVLPAIYGIKEIAANGLDSARVACIAAGVIAGVAFIFRQARARAPMIDLKLFRSRGFTASVMMNLVAMFAIIGFAVFTTQYLESVLGMRPFTAALWSLVPMAGTMAATLVTRALAQRLDRAYIAVGGFLLAGAGFAALTQVHVHSPIWFVLTAASVYAGGVLAVMSIGSELIMGAVPPERAGAAAAVAETATEFGGALGIAILGSIGTAAYRSSLAAAAPAGTPPAALGAARATLGSALTAASRLPGRAGAGLADAARAAFAHGLDYAALGAASAMIVGAALTAAFLRGIRTESSTAADLAAERAADTPGAGGGSVTELKATTCAPVRVLTGPSYEFDNPRAVTVDGARVWMANSGGDSVTEFPASPQ
jgi:MFS transporter, DHA2 family, multidrug resistance protein